MKKKPEQDSDFYYNKEGYLVMTRKYHLERGYCCGNGCLHCPYDYANVPEARRDQLLQQRETDHGFFKK